MEKLSFDNIVKIGNKAFTKKNIELLTYEEREECIEPLFNLFRLNGIVYPDNSSKLKKSYKSLCEYSPDLNVDEVFNNSSLGTDICKYFCRSFYNSKSPGGMTMEDVFNDDKLLKKLIKNRLGMDWLKDDSKGVGVNEAFNLSPKMLLQGMRSMMLVSQISMFKPSIAKYICLKYSNPGDLVLDYSVGFGGRMLGAVSCNRRYIGTDPLTTPEVTEMVNYFGFEGVKLINSGSENYCGDSECVDLCYSSPPYYNQEYYSDDKNQAYNNGKEYFYNVYWEKTLQNAKRMLKTGKVFGLNVKNYPKMVDMAREEFGAEVESIALRTVRSHLAHKEKNGNEKSEYIYIFRKD
jgi:hypothetical protein